MGREAWLRWTLGLGIAFLVLVTPLVLYREEYTRHKRFRVVNPGVLYRSGQMTVGGYSQEAHRHGIRTIINLQDEFPDPDIQTSYYTWFTVKETDLCRRLGVRYIHIAPDLLPHRQIPEARPRAIEQFLEIMDNPDNYPVLIHCKAGLHRTGVITAVYRMEYQGWSQREAIAELKDNGFGEFACSSANDYITQYVLTYRPGVRNPLPQGSKDRP